MRVLFFIIITYSTCFVLFCFVLFCFYNYKKNEYKVIHCNNSTISQNAVLHTAISRRELFV